MNMIVGKKQIVLASLVAALGVAVYLNYQFAGEDLELVTANTTQQTAVEGALEETQEQEHYGDAQFVDSKQVAQNTQEGQVVQIRDIILGETKVPVENISIVSVK